MGMRRPRFNMGKADYLGAESVGLPGQRTFRLLVAADGKYAQLWLEKEQLQALAEATARMLLEISNEGVAQLSREVDMASNPKPPDFPENPEIELSVGAIRLRYESARDLIAIEITDRESDDETSTQFSCMATREQMQVLQTTSIEVVSSGRPRCPLCGTPLPAAGVPHFCPPTNGHQKIHDEDDIS